MKKLFREFKEFAMQGNILDLAVGIMIGGAFGKIVSSLVSDIFMPFISLITGLFSSTGFNMGGLFLALDGGNYPSAEAAANAGVAVLNYGAFLTNVIDFILIAICVFMVVKLMTRLMPKKAEAPSVPMRECPYCKTSVNAAATRCPNCTSELTPEVAESKA